MALDDIKVAEFMGETRSGLAALVDVVDNLRSTLVGRIDSSLVETNRRFEEQQKVVSDNFRLQGERIGKLEDALDAHKVECKEHAPSNGWRDKKVAIGAGGGAGLLALIEMIRHWLTE